MQDKVAAWGREQQGAAGSMVTGDRGCLVVYPCRSGPTSGAPGVIASDYLSYDRSSVCP